ncbi:MAG: hypothetical protein ACYC4L_22440 [Chloroflexota bacterium]
MALEQQTNPNVAASRHGNVVAGGVLITMGTLALVGQLLPNTVAGPLFLLMVGLAFLAWGLFARQAGLLIPGSIISGLGVGVATLEAYESQLPAPADGGVVLLGLALGFAGVTVLTTPFAGRTHWWALIPASIIGLVGTALIASVEVGPALVLLKQVWPLFLILVGVALLLRRGRD